MTRSNQIAIFRDQIRLDISLESSAADTLMRFHALFSPKLRKCHKKSQNLLYAAVSIVLKCLEKIIRKSCTLISSASYFLLHYLTIVSIKVNSVDPDQTAPTTGAV